MQEKAYTLKLHEEYKSIYYLEPTSAGSAGGHVVNPQAIKPSGAKAERGPPPLVMQGIPTLKESHMTLGYPGFGFSRKTLVVKNEFFTFWKIDVQ